MFQFKIVGNNYVDAILSLLVEIDTDNIDKDKIEDIIKILN